jgi:hypothetical protein
MPAEAVVLALGYRSVALDKKIVPEGTRLVTAGDAVKPRSILDAVHEGSEAVHSVLQETAAGRI